MICSYVFRPRKVAQAGLLGLIFTFAIAARAQDEAANFKAVPVLTGYSSYFTRVNAGQIQDVPGVSPLLLVPVGDKWLLEAKGSYSETFSKDPDDNYFENKASYGLGYAQADR